MEKGKLQCYCLHWVDHLSDQFMQNTMDWTAEGERKIQYASYCKDCAAENERMGIVLDDEEEEREWLEGKRQYPIGEE